MKKVILTFVSILLLSISMFAINFGGGGYFFNYVPKDQVKQINPLKDYVEFGDLILHGGGGMGIMPGGTYMGGEGYSGQVIKDNYILEVSQGGFVFGRYINLFNVMGINIGMGLGGGETVISKKVEESRNGKSISDFVNNVDSVPYVIQLKREEISVSPRIALHLNIIEFISLVIEGKFVYNYSPENWKIDGEYNITDQLPNYNYYYSFGAKFMWGF